jgi:hypothetical protein
MPMQESPLLAVRPQWPQSTGSGKDPGAGAAPVPESLTCTGDSAAHGDPGEESSLTVSSKGVQGGPAESIMAPTPAAP